MVMDLSAADAIRPSKLYSTERYIMSAETVIARIANTPEKLLQGEDVDNIPNISRAMTYQLIQNDQLPALRIGRSVCMYQVDLRAFIQQNRFAPDQSLQFLAA